MSDPAKFLEPLEVEKSSRKLIATRQSKKLTTLIRSLPVRNQFYAKKFSRAGLSSVDNLVFPDDLHKLPFTTKAELVSDQSSSPPWGTALSEPVSNFSRYNQTSSTTGKPLRWIDTTESWQWMLDCWKTIYRAARVTSTDRIIFPFSFGPFLGFWTGFDAATQLGAHAIPTGGISSQSRLALIETLRPTVMCCTPTYALRLLDVASESSTSLTDTTVRVIIVAGEPGGNIPVTRQRIEEGWAARVIDHHGLTEVGPVSFECWEAPGFLHINEQEYVAEIIDPESDQPVPDGQQGELVITNLGRSACPIVRYRTRDLVIRTSEPCTCGRTFARLVGGVIARADDMVNVRGVNVYPTAIEAIIRSVETIVEYRCTIKRDGAMRSVIVEIELCQSSAIEPSVIADEVSSKLHQALGLTVPVRCVGHGTLPRFEMKARRFFVEA